MAGPKKGPGPKPKSPTTVPEEETASFAITSGTMDAPQRVLLYGTGGIGKSTLAGLAPGALFIDLEEGSRELDVQRIEGVDSFGALLAALRSPILEGYGTIVIDSATKAEEMAIAHTLQHVPNEKGHHVDSIEGYGFGKGYMFVYETFLLLLQGLDAQVRAGRNVILIAHDCVENVPNPLGEDWIRYEPHLQRPKSGKASIRNRVIQWADHVLFLAYDVVAEDGKAQGGGTRTVYPAERPTHIAKSRLLADPISFDGPADSEVWDDMFGGA